MPNINGADEVPPLNSAEEAAEQPRTAEEIAFDRIREKVSELDDLDARLQRINSLLAEAKDEPEPEPEPELKYQQVDDEQEEDEPQDTAEEIFLPNMPLSPRARAVLAAANGASWQILLGFGISFAVRVGFLGIWLGSWLDKRYFGGEGFFAMGMILLVLVYSFYMLYRDVMRQDRLQKEAVQRELAAEKNKK
ncbi:MAG: AtpZ/AtpI family protein [Firmicutes bacterium]|nr:AtpZ/AtpI family protein [Bacillota bacterium]